MSTALTTTAPFTIERTYQAPASVVWDAITNREKMKEWYFDLDQFEAVEGFEFRFTGSNKDRVYHHICKVTKVEPGKKLSYSWQYEGYPGYSEVSFELFPEGDNTRVRLTHAGLESFPSDTSDFAKENFVAGWTQIIGTNLKGFVEKQ